MEKLVVFRAFWIWGLFTYPSIGGIFSDLKELYIIYLGLIKLSSTEQPESLASI